MSLPLPPISAYPSDLTGQNNGKIDPKLLTDCGIDNWYTTPPKAQFKMHHLASRAMKALVADALIAGFQVRATGTYRSYEEQVNLFLQRYTTTYSPYGSKVWNGVIYYKKANVAMAAVPGTSNHGWGLAVDFAEERDQDPAVEAVSQEFVDWLIRNARNYGYWAEAQSEPWHWRYCSGDLIPEVVLRFENPHEPDPVGPILEASKMKPLFWRNKGFANVFYVENANVIHVSPKLFDKLAADDPAIDKMVDDHIQTFKSLTSKAGITINDWVTSPGDTGVNF